ncbi:MAG: hypothetical protein JXM70_06280 [Pirellulales bacterium]|nr:hypothetical protein [Pirellulales bacterium]
MRSIAMKVGATRLVCILIMATLVVGCSQGPPMGEVTGNVVINGTPAKTGSISFFPVDGKSTTTGASITDGKYSAMVPLGKVKIELRVSKVVGQKKLYPTPDSPVQPIMQEVLPPKYNNQTNLEMEVQKGTNQKDFDIKL